MDTSQPNLDTGTGGIGNGTGFDDSIFENDADNSLAFGVTDFEEEDDDGMGDFFGVDEEEEMDLEAALNDEDELENALSGDADEIMDDIADYDEDDSDGEDEFDTTIVAPEEYDVTPVSRSYTGHQTSDADNDGTVIAGDNVLMMGGGDEDDGLPNTLNYGTNGGVISSTGEIVVMDKDGSNAFELKYIDTKNIAIPNRIRKTTNIDALVRSIQSTGLLQPITVAPTVTEGVYSLVHGMRRLLAAHRVGVTIIPCLVNNKISTTEIPIVEALCNHHRSYSVTELINYIDYLEKQMGIMSASMIEYLCQMESGDYTKLKDLLDDDDEEIMSKLLNDQLTIAEAFKKLEQRRKKESRDEKENKKADKVYNDEEASGADRLGDSGESVADLRLTDEEIAEISISASELDDMDESFEEMAAASHNMEGYEPHKQDVNNRERIDPALKKAVLSRDQSRCKACKKGGPGSESGLDFHHITPVFLGGSDTEENGITLCLFCHNLVHVYSYGNLHIPESTMTPEDKEMYKRIFRLGNVIREGMKKKGIKLDKAKKERPGYQYGRRMPGSEQTTK